MAKATIADDLAATTPPSLLQLDESPCQSNLDQSNHGRPNKRPRIGRSSLDSDIDLSTVQDGYLCFAKVDICLVLYRSKASRVWDTELS